MYILTSFAKNKIVLVTIFIIVFVLIIFFPIFIRIKAELIKNENKIFFKFYLFKIIKVYSMYLDFKSDAIFIHLTKKKAVLIKYSSLINIRAKVKPLKDFHFIKLITQIHIGSTDNDFLLLETYFFINYIFQNIKWFFSNKKPYLKLDNQIFLYENEKLFNIYIDLSLILNIFMVILSIIKITVEAIINGISKRKQQNKQYN